MKIQKQGIKTVAELITAGGTAADLPQDTQVYVTAGSINKTLNQAITDGDIVTTSASKIVARYRLTSNIGSDSTLPINFDTMVYDTHSAVTTSPTAWKFTAPRNDYYQVVVNAQVSSPSSVSFELHLNNTNIGWGLTTLNSSYYETSVATIYLTTGDYIDVRCMASSTVIGAANNYTYISITA